MGRSSSRVFIVAAAAALVLGALALRPFVGAAAEPNDTFDSATPIGFNFTYRDAIASAGDVDYFSFTVGVAQTQLTTGLTELPEDYALELYGPDRALIASSDNAGASGESIAYTAARTGTYYLRVFSPTGASSASQYALRIDGVPPTATPTRTPVPTITPTPFESYEPSGSHDAAMPLYAGQTLRARITPSGDRDYYRIAVASSGARITATLSDLPADYDLYLERPDRSTAASSTNAGTTAESLSYPVGSAPGAYYLIVLAPAGASSSASYSLTVDVELPPDPPGGVFVVDDTSDEPDAALGDGFCATASGRCTFLAAVHESNQLPGPNVIRLGAGTHTLPTGGAISIAGELHVVGAGRDVTLLDGAQSRRGGFLSILPDSVVTLRDLRSARGAGIYNDRSVVRLDNVYVGSWQFNCRDMMVNAGGDMALWRTTISSGGASDALVNLGRATIVESRISGYGGTCETTTLPSHRGRGISNGGWLVMDGSEVSANFAGAAGGIWNSGTAYITSSTIALNRAVETGGGIYNTGTLSLLNSTVYGNRAQLWSGSVGRPEDVTNERSLVYKNTIVGRCEGNLPPTSLGNNLHEYGGCGHSSAGDIVDTDPRLLPWGVYGGSTNTFALSAESPAVDRADNGSCPATDQRGVARPQGAACDMGAFELMPSGVAVTATPTPYVTAFPTSTPSPTATATATPTHTSTPVRPPGPNRLVLPVLPNAGSPN